MKYEKIHMNQNNNNENEMDYYNDSIEKAMKESHIEHCYKDKVFKQSLPISIYLTGKIEKNGWREEIVGYRCGEMYGGDYTKKELAEHDIEYEKKRNIYNRTLVLSM